MRKIWIPWFFLEGKENVDLDLGFTKDRIENICVIINSAWPPRWWNHNTGQAAITCVGQLVLENLHVSGASNILDTFAEISATLGSLESVSSQGLARPSICNTGSNFSSILYTSRNSEHLTAVGEHL